jgi:hypothetical protein
MKSVRFEAELEEKLRRAAAALEISQSEFIRDAVARRCNEVLTTSLYDEIAPLVGVIHSSGGRANDTGAAFRALLAKKRRT